MHQTIPRVEGGRLFQPEKEGDPILIGTPAWYDWLEQQSSFRFVERLITFTAHKSVLRTGGANWKAYRRCQGKLYRIHLGRSQALTQERLQAAAQAFAGEHDLGEHASMPSRQLGASRFPRPPSPRMALDVDPSTSFIHSKLSQPRLGSDLIPRPRLLERLNAGLGSKVTLVCAPAGYGKTTLLAAWVQTIDRPTTWLSLDEHDDELSSFVRSLTAALQNVFPDAFGAIASQLQAARLPALDTLVALFSNDLADLPEDLLLVLDDYHRIRTSEVHSLIERLVEHLPSQVHLVLSSRTDPQLPLACWQAQGHLHELRGSDLCFTLQETETFLEREVGSVTAREVASVLEERTEGWIAMVRLAALSLRNAPDQMAFLEQLGHAPDPTFSRYLVEEVLSRQTPAVQEFVIRMSMLDQFCAGLCKAVMGSDASDMQMQVILEELDRSNLFLVPLDGRHGWYRFHHLFQQLLQERLQSHRSEDEIAMFHTRASAWYVELGLIDEAIEHARKSGDELSATRLVESQFLRVFEQEQWVRLERWLRLLPEEHIQGSIVLLVARVWIVQAQGRLNEMPRWLTAAGQLLAISDSERSEQDNTQSRILHALVATLWSMAQYFTGQTRAGLESARSALEWLPPDEEYVTSLTLMFLAWSNQAIGNEDVALGALQQALTGHVLSINSTARLLFARAWVSLAAGKLHQVEHTARHLLHIAQKADLELSHYHAHWLLGVVYYEWNDLERAAYHFSAVVANQHQAHFWMVQDAMHGLALAYEAQGMNAQAQGTVRALLEVVQGRNNMRELLKTYAFCGRLALLQNNVEESTQWLELAGDQEVQGPMMFFEVPSITKAWALLAKGDEPSVAQGQALLSHLLHHAQAMHSTRKTIQVLALQAWAYDLQGLETEALDVLEQALALGCPGGFVRTFADLPPLLKVLAELRRRRKEQQEVDEKQDAYLQAILVAMSPTPAQAVSTKELMRQEGLEPLTERELQILHLLERGLTNREIASELVVTPGTVKLHTNHVYRKLSVNNRHAAVTLARALGLLAIS
jgi:ATP/maltotriose-dependent transcriptional regulator MalT